jgi:thiosulfate dehydrogenase [quinone] large subunit
MSKPDGPSLTRGAPKKATPARPGDRRRTALLVGGQPLPIVVRQVGWVLLPLRAFLAFVFLYAGISKVADRSFLDSGSPTGIHATLLAVRGASPIGSLLGPVQDHSFAFGLLMSIAEIAVGVGFALGLFTRIASVGAMVLSLSLFLTVSWGASPWYTGADLVYLFASTPLLIGGSGGVFSLDGWLASAARRQPGVGEDRTRRVLLGGAAAVGVLVLLGIAAIARSGSDADDTDSAGDADGASSSTPSPSTSTAASGLSPGASSAVASSAPAAAGAEFVAASAVAVGKGKQVKDPKTGDPAWVLQLTAGQFTAYDAICPHQGCTVGFVSAKEGFACPCHGSRFAADGRLLGGPATRGLTAIPVTVTDGAVRRT